MPKKKTSKPKSPLQEQETLGGKIQKAREARGLTVTQAARRLSVLPKTLSNWESNSSVPRANQLQILSGVLYVPVFWLIGGIDHVDDDQDIPEIAETADLERRLKKLIQVHGETAQLLFDMQTELRRLQNKIDSTNGSM